MRIQKLLPLVAGILCFAGGPGSARAEIIDDSTPVPPQGQLGAPVPGLTPAEVDEWIRGRLVFDRDWRGFEGVGSDFNGDSCRACHQDGAPGGAGGLDVNVFRFARDEGGMGPFTDLPGGQIASKLRFPMVPGREDHSPDADVFEQRNSPALFGMGLIDEIADATILANEDPTDGDGDGIFGIARLLTVAGVTEVGRFGWKSGVPHTGDFIADAMGQELGITVADNGRGFSIPTDSDNVADPELLDSDLTDLMFFLNKLAPPPRAGGSSPMIGLGEQVFADVGCDTCHIPTLDGPGGPVALYSNLLLHDVHPSDFRAMTDPGAPAGYYRTAPLWGLRFSAPYMHDGRAETVEDAILLHAGEASEVTANYEDLTSAEKDALIAFLLDL